MDRDRQQAKEMKGVKEKNKKISTKEWIKGQFKNVENNKGDVNKGTNKENETPVVTNGEEKRRVISVSQDKGSKGSFINQSHQEDIADTTTKTNIV